MLDFSTEMVSGVRGLSALHARLASARALALDIETVNWWDREAERVSLIQLAFREGGRVRVALVDALAEFDPEPLRAPLESDAATKAIHNAAYDAGRLARHFRLRTSPIHDTMLAAQRGGEKRCSLQAQVEAHLGIRLDKGEQRGDWSRRPLSESQVRYAALDAACTLLLYEDQLRRGLTGSYRLREAPTGSQTLLPLGEASPTTPTPSKAEPHERSDATVPTDLTAPAVALLGVLTELAGRYSPERLAASAGSDRVGLAGWIIDRTLGAGADMDEDTVRLFVAELCERRLVKLDATRRLATTDAGARLWQQLKP
jgi:3'-5' exonuclease